MTSRSGYSFVQEAADIDLLQQELRQRQDKQAQPLALIAKIETPRAVRNLPELIVHAAGKQPLGVMIARGDLVVEIGYERLAEIVEATTLAALFRRLLGPGIACDIIESPSDCVPVLWAPPPS